MGRGRISIPLLGLLSTFDSLNNAGSLVRRTPLMMSGVFEIDCPPNANDDWFLWRRIVPLGWRLAKSAAVYRYRKHAASKLAQMNAARRTLPRCRTSNGRGAGANHPRDPALGANGVLAPNGRVPPAPDRASRPNAVAAELGGDPEDGAERPTRWSATNESRPGQRGQENSSRRPRRDELKTSPRRPPGTAVPQPAQTHPVTPVLPSHPRLVLGRP